MILPLLLVGGLVTALVLLKEAVPGEKFPTQSAPPIPPDPNVQNFFVQKGSSYLVTLKYKAGIGPLNPSGTGSQDAKVIAAIAVQMGFDGNTLEVPTPQPNQEPCVFRGKYTGEDRYIGTKDGVLNVTGVYPIALLHPWVVPWWSDC